MRPEILFPLFTPTSGLKGVGRQVAAMLARLAGDRVIDVIWHLPTGAIDRQLLPDSAAATPGAIATLRLRIGEHRPPARRGSPYRIAAHDAAGALDLVFFNAEAGYLQRVLPQGEERLVSGQVDSFGGAKQMVHPDYILPLKDAGELPAVEPVYPLTQGLAGKRLRAIMAAALARLPDLPEWIDPHFKAQHHWPDWKPALLALHRPMAPGPAVADSPARRRLAYDEIFANQLALALVRARMRARPGRALKGDGRLRHAVMHNLAYRPTGAQDRAVAEILADMESPHAMLRLLQGDVGSGKTYVALMAMLAAVEAGAQAAMLAPTEILARQHGATIAAMLEGVDVRLEVLTGRDKGKRREAVRARLAAGEVDILVGTHAVIQEDVAFHSLGLAVIDEQHRFGVHQRLMLAAKGEDKARLDVLVMTATPIPRTLTLALYGEMDVSRLDEKPPGRQPVDTRVVPVARLDDVVEALRRAVARGERAYWVCPLVEESEASELAAAQARHAHLKRVFGDRVGLIHGRLKPAQKDAVMAAFQSGALAVLVATTVIEVGVDVPEATIMIIEQAERFGLAQLHQLRGRVGRGHGKSVCLLLRSAELGETARARLGIMRETEDGFRIAEEDLKLRGGGELLGTRQSGAPEFRLVDLAAHADLLPAAQSDARVLVTRDPLLQTPRGAAARVLLYLFERDAAVRLLKSG
ncbi:MAG: ATP-dependent DNA helicase RecG [Pseudomonadota bacterium]